MTVKIERTLTLANVEADLVVLPMHARYMSKSLTIHPTLSETCLDDFPMAYSYYRNRLKESPLSKGDVLFYEDLDSTPVLILIARGDIRRKFDMRAIIAGLVWMNKQRLHDRYSIAFPGIGCYEEDRISAKTVYRMVKKYLSDGEKTVHFVVNY